MGRKGTGYYASAWLFLGVALWVLSSGALSAWAQYTPEGRVNIRHENALFTEEDIINLDRVMKDELQGGRAAGFIQQLKQTVGAEETAGSAIVDVLWITGDASLLMEVQMIAGNLPTQGDKTGCALSSDTALTLFGSTDILGKTVTLVSAEFTVQGIYETQLGATAFLANPGREIMYAPFSAAQENTAMTSLTVLPVVKESQTVVEVAMEALRLAGVSTGGTIADHSSTYALLMLLSTLPALLCAALTLLSTLSSSIALFKRAAVEWVWLKEDRLTPYGCYVRLVARCVGILAALVGPSTVAIWLMPVLPAIPSKYLPTAWSDFSFWSKLFEEVVISIANRSLVIAQRPDMIRDSLTRWVSMLPLLATVCLWHANGRRKAIKEMPLPLLFVAVAILTMAVLFGLWLTDYLDWAPTAYQYMVALPMFPLLIQFITVKGCIADKRCSKVEAID